MHFSLQLLAVVAVLVVVAIIILMAHLYKHNADNGKKMIVFFILGGPGAGKGTQCENLREIFPEMISLSTGHLLRQKTKEDTPRGKEV